MDELEPVVESYWEKATRIVRELREIADTIEANPELAMLDDPYDAAERLLMDLDSLGDLEDVL
jgi:aminoglycoside phosphotransferase family enzyme